MTRGKGFSKKEVNLLLNIVEAESIKIDSLKSSTVKEASDSRETLNSIKKKLPNFL